jgi:D-citramalate synthase
MRQIEILDTTLRDGEQTSGISFSTSEKLAITRLLLEELNIPRVEIASARVSSGEKEAVTAVCNWAQSCGRIDSIEVLGFLDNGVSIDWIQSVGGKVVNLLCKGSEKHCHLQLKQTLDEHISAITREINYAKQCGFKVNVYLEDWSNGIKDNAKYVFQLVDALSQLPIERFMLPDTLGILNPYNTYECVKKMIERYPNLRFDFHAHNDYDLATGNVFAAVIAGITGVHSTINGLGERAGNATLSSIVAMIHDQAKCQTGVNESKINKVSRIVESFSGIIIPPNKPIIGESVFTQCAGVHADGDNKSNLYFNDLLPERFGRSREYALGKTSGKANIKKNLEALGIVLSEKEIQKVTQRIIELGDKKEIVTQGDLPFIVADVVKHTTLPSNVAIVNYALNLTQGLRPTATVKLAIEGQEYQETGVGDGQFDAFMNAVRSIYRNNLQRELPTLANYSVNIPPGGRTNALVHTTITWNHNGIDLKTRGLDADQTEAAIQATIKMLNIIENYN